MLLLMALCSVAGASAIDLGLQYIPGAISGLIPGFFGAVFGGRLKAVYAIAAICLATAFSGGAPAWVSYYASAPDFAVLAGIELTRFGTRVSVFKIMSWNTLRPSVAGGQARSSTINYGQGRR